MKNFQIRPICVFFYLFCELILYKKAHDFQSVQLAWFVLTPFSFLKKYVGDSLRPLFAPHLLAAQGRGTILLPCQPV